MNKLNSFSFLIVLFLLLTGCNQNGPSYTISVENKLQLTRMAETVAIRKSDLGNITCEVFSRFSVQDSKTGEFLPVQVIDEDMDGELDYLLFQPVLDADEARNYNLIADVDTNLLPEPEKSTFSRFVPERTDDYAWENDRVAFRTYGPIAQQMVEEGIPGGTLSSGIDCWLKRVEYPIINKWYKKHLEEGGSYHEDTGEGLDDFHVGASRGCGGVGIWSDDEQKLYTSRNFIEWETMAVGPIRTLFELTYAPWSAPVGMVDEKKIISLDLGSNLTRYKIRISGDNPLEVLSVGLTLHEKDGNIQVDQENGWFSYWQPHGDSKLGMGIVAEPRYLVGYTEHLTEEADKSHLLVHLRPVNGKVVYYAGFGWGKSRQFSSESEWIEYLQGYASRLSLPLSYQVK